MALDKTGRFEIYEWGSATDPFTRDQMTESHQVLKTRAAGFVTTEESQPDTDLNGYFYYTSTDSSAGILKYSNGVDWFNINESGTVVSLDGTTSDGTGTAFALANHKHALDDSVVTTAKINDLAVTEGKIAAGAVTTDKLGSAAVTNAKLGSDLDASKLTDGTLPVARIASGAITNVKLGTDLDASKLTAGTLPAARIGANNITVDKIEQVAAHGVLARVDSTTGDLSELTASTNQVLGRGASGNLTFAQVSTGQIASGAVTNAKLASTGLDATKLTTGTLDVARITDGAVTNAKLANMGANTVKIRQSSTGVPQNVEIGSNRVLGRDGSGALQSTQVERAMIADGAINGDKIADDAVTLGTKTSGNYVKSVTGGTNINATSTPDGEGGQAVSLVHTTHSGTSSTGDATGTVVTALSLSNGHVGSFTTYNLDTRFPLKTKTYAEPYGAGYWVQYSTDAPIDGDGAPDGSIYLQYTT